MHPEATGWFAPGELESRRGNGHRFDISLRHVTPSTPYGVLEELVPGAAFVTIMRRPVERFLSLFNFRGDVKMKFKVSGSRRNHSTPITQEVSLGWCAWRNQGAAVLRA